MPVADFLLAIAQLGVALAGFSGLIAAIRTTSPEGWHPRDIWSLSWMLGTSIGAFVLALLPLWLSMFDWALDVVYRIASSIACVFTLSLVAIQVRTGRRMTRNGFPPRVPFFPFALASLLSIAGVALGIGATGAWGRSLMAAYAGGLIALLLASTMVLAIFLILLARHAHRP